jgi:site-specific recombinase XerD
MIIQESGDRASLAVPQAGRLVRTGEPWMPYRLADPAGVTVQAAEAYFGELLACGRAGSTVRSYGMDLLRWWRFLWAAEVSWERATRAEARDFSCWIQATAKPCRGAAGGAPGAVNTVTGKRAPGRGYAPATVAHSETVLRALYDFHREAGTGPVLNPFPLRRSGRANAHHNPMDTWNQERAGRYRPVVPARIPRAIPDRLFDEMFAELGSHRDRALVAFYVSTGARASELLGVRQHDMDPGQQLVTVVRKGSRAVQQVPASPDAFVWFRLYQEEIRGLVPSGRDAPVWWTRRRPFRPLAYHAAHRMFTRASQKLGANWTLHDLRHTAAHRMARDPVLPLTDVQWVLGHAQLTTTQAYLTPARAEVIEDMLAYHTRRVRQREQPAPPAAPGYDPRSLDILLGRSS